MNLKSSYFVYIHLRDTFGRIYQDELFADLYPDRGQPAYAPWRLALATVFQFMENLTDRQAADAVCSRLDWKYALVRRVAHGDILGATRKNEKGHS